MEKQEGRTNPIESPLAFLMILQNDGRLNVSLTSGKSIFHLIQM